MSKTENVFNYIATPLVAILTVLYTHLLDALLMSDFLRFDYPHQTSALRDTIIGGVVVVFMIVVLIILFRKRYRKKYSPFEKIVMIAFLTYLIGLVYYSILICTNSMIFVLYKYIYLDWILMVGIPVVVLIPLFKKNSQI